MAIYGHVALRFTSFFQLIVVGRKSEGVTMAKNWLLSSLYSLLFVAFALTGQCQESKVHVVYMGELPKGGVSVASHHAMLENVLGSTSKAKESLIYSYGKSFSGFAARLTDEEAATFSEMEGVVSVLPNNKLQLHTTRSWDFMGLPLENGRYGSNESDIIVGLLDTGIWPEAKSFSDEGFGPPPAKWNGTCQTADNFTCNNKLIGARYYNSEDFYFPTDFKSPRDSEGHGTHTSSTAAGRALPGVSYQGLGKGTARGGVPLARIAMYKVCWSFGCAVADILAAFDDAIADGVDIISVSLGSPFPSPYFDDVIAIGAFHAMKKGILTSNSAGNSGPYPVTVANYAPWALTVAASSIDRKFVSQVVLGNGQSFIGNAINPFVLNGTAFPLIDGGSAPNVSAGMSSDISKYCYPETLNSDKVQGKIVLCDTIWDGSGVLLPGGLGNIMISDEYSDFAFSYPLSSSLINIDDGAKVWDYIHSSENPIGTILHGETFTDGAAPRVVSFSSRGPNPINPDILKPDLTAPGVDILAAWSPVAPPSIYYADTSRVEYNIISGTSMSCPHASGAAAFVKAAHPSWSPAAIKSALMTTARVMDARKNTNAEFAYGSGHINPSLAINPGLVYDADEKDYIEFLCNTGYNTTTLRLVTGDSSTCSGNGTGNAWDLNYPSFALAIPDGKPIQGTFQRRVTNVGPANSTYQVTIYAPSLQVSVEPSVLSFTSTGDVKSFTVTVSGKVISQQPIISGYIAWKDGVHVVRSPLAVFTVLSNGSPIGDGSGGYMDGSSMSNTNGILRRH